MGSLLTPELYSFLKFVALLVLIGYVYNKS
ncbi:hypothetical protein LPLM1_00089 [Listeria phage LPML1]|nr:hypothetical protein LPLM1_00089 [Listeria phage LPML1]